MRTMSFMFCWFLAGTCWAPAQTILAPGQVGVVTSDGFFLPDTAGSTPLLTVPATLFLGSPSLALPAVEWERGTDGFLVATGPGLFRVTIQGLAPPAYSVTDITPQSSLPLDLRDLDLHPGTGDLYLVDLTSDTVLHFEPPFTAGMQASDSIPIHPRCHAIAVDSRSDPNALDSLATGEVRRQSLAGGAPAVVTYVNGPTGLDHDVRFSGQQGTFIVSKGGNLVARATNNPNLVVDMNFLGFCSPLALGPVDIEWDPLSNRAFVLAQDGINNGGFCFGAIPAVGPNHIVKFPTAQGGPVAPALYTALAGSGITGVDGDLAIVYGDFGFVSPYGSGCTPGPGPAAALDLLQPALTVASTAVTVQVESGSAGAPVWILLGLQRAATALPSGCLLLTSTDEAVLAGSTDSFGTFEASYLLPPLAAGFEFHLQAGVLEVGGASLSEGLFIHVGL